MQCVYESSNPIEAHILVDVLKQHGVAARIDGEYLQGGIGELQPMGYIRILVDEGDYDSARSIIRDWEVQ